MDWIRLLDFESDLETIISNAHASMHVVIFPATLLICCSLAYMLEMAYDDDTPTLPAPMLMAAWCFVLPSCVKDFSSIPFYLKKTTG